MNAPYWSECLYAIPHMAWPFESATVHRMVGVHVLMEGHVLFSIRSVVSDWDCQSACFDSMFPIWDTEGRHAASSSASPTPSMPFRITSEKQSCARCTTLLVLMR